MKYAIALALAAIFALGNTADILRRYEAGPPTFAAVFTSQLMACALAMLILASAL